MLRHVPVFDGCHGEMNKTQSDIKCPMCRVRAIPHELVEGLYGNVDLGSGGLGMARRDLLFI